MNKIKEIRESKNITQEELATIAKVSRKSLSSYENGKGNPTTRTIAKLAKALNCEIRDLI